MEKAIQGFLVFLREEKKVSHNTEISYTRDLKHAKEFLQKNEGKELVNATGEDLEGYIAWVKENRSVATVSRRIVALRAFYKYCMDKGYITDNPTAKIAIPRIEKKDVKILSSEEIDRLPEQPDKKTPKGMRDKAMLALLCATGIRVSEIITLTVDDIDLRHLELCCGEKKVRYIPFDEKVKHVLNKYLKNARSVFTKDNDERWLFMNFSGKTMSRQGFWKMFKGYAEQAGIGTDITPHTLRHSVAARQVEKGVSPKDIQQMMGFADVSATALYRK